MTSRENKRKTENAPSTRWRSGSNSGGPSHGVFCPGFRENTCIATWINHSFSVGSIFGQPAQSHLSPGSAGLLAVSGTSMVWRKLRLGRSIDRRFYREGVSGGGSPFHPVSWESGTGLDLMSVGGCYIDVRLGFGTVFWSLGVRRTQE